MKKIRVFLTGGGGFIGRNILELLGGKYYFLSPNSKELDLTDADAVLRYIKQNNVDIVLHAANVGGNRNPKWTGVDWVLEKNLKMFFNLVRSKDYFERMIVLGSGAEYDKRQNISKIEEGEFEKSMPIDQYGFAKYIMSKYAQNVDFITHLRLFGVYGKYEDKKIRFISETICRALLNQPIIIKQNVNFDYMYINDVVKIIDNFIDNKPTQNFYNVGCGTTKDLIFIANKILSLIGKDLPVIVENSGLNKEYSCNVDRLLGEIKGSVCTDFDQSLIEMIDYYKSILPQLEADFVL